MRLRRTTRWGVVEARTQRSSNARASGPIARRIHPLIGSKPMSSLSRRGGRSGPIRAWWSRSEKPLRLPHSASQQWCRLRSTEWRRVVAKLALIDRFEQRPSEGRPAHTKEVGGTPDVRRLSIRTKECDFAEPSAERSDVESRMAPSSGRVVKQCWWTTAAEPRNPQLDSRPGDAHTRGDFRRRHTIQCQQDDPAASNDALGCS
jgi:hypothetical protein